METIIDLLKKNPFFKDLTSEEITYIAGCGKQVVFSEGQSIAHRGDSADEFYLLCEGSVTLAIDMPSKKPFVFHTLGPSEIFGLSWLIPPFQWTLTAIAKEETSAIAFGGACLRGKCEQEPKFGFKLMKKVVQLLLMREEALRLHVLDIYG